jgi:hypothetical protein
VMRLQRAAGNRVVARMLKAPERQVARYGIEGAWDINDPMHEVLTLVAIRKAMDARGATKGDLLSGVNAPSLPKDSSTTAHNLSPESDIHSSAAQFVRGVIWADDPMGWLFDADEDLHDYSSGLKWYHQFDPKYKADPKALIGRSHYGDLQFFHGMASADKEAAADTKKKILDWARFLIDIAAGRTDPNTKLKDIPLAARLFSAYPEWTVKRLFVYEKGPDLAARQRATGVLMHLIQDSHAKGHVERDPGTGEIKNFHSYESQDHGEHGHYDEWAAGATLADRIKNTYGAQSAVEKCAAVLVMLDKGDATDDIIKYLDEVVFKLSATVSPAGPGAGFEKKPPPPKSDLTPIERHH